MLHKNVGIGDNHPTHNWEYANAAARTGATGFVAGDVHKLALQLDDLSLWILVNTTPTWQQFGVGYTNEQAQDAVGGILTDSATIDFTYDDAGNTITAVTKQQMSITSDASGLKLSGDAASPGNNKVYGTNASGVKGWKDDPAGGGGSSRELLTADRTYYVRTDGSDSNNGLTDNSGGAFLTIQKAVNVISASLDIQTFNVTIQVRSGTYTGAVNLLSYLGTGTVTLQGDTVTPTNVVISTTSADCITNSSRRTWLVKGFALTAATSGSAFVVSEGGSVVDFYNITFQACATYHILATAHGKIIASTNYTISAAALIHVASTEGGLVNIVGRTITITGTPAFSTAYTYLRNLGIFNAYSCTFSGSATGVRFLISLNAVCFVNGAGSTYFPGNASGTTSTGGQYS